LENIKLVAGDGTGDYNCDGSADQGEINKALAWAASNPGNKIHLVGPFTYDLTDQLLIGSSTVFSGDPTAKLRLNNNCLWPAMKPVIGQLEGRGAATHDVEICGFEIDLNQSHLYKPGTDTIHGHAYYNTFYIKGSATNPASSISVHDVHWHDGLGDGPRLEYCKDISIYNCDFRDLMHSSIYLIDSETIELKNNYIEAITNAGIRFDNCRKAVAYNNTIKDFIGTTYAPKAGAHGFQIGNQPANYGRTNVTQYLELYNNNISVGACGILLEDPATTNLISQSVYIHNNNISNCGKTNWADYFCGIASLAWGNGIIIENNTLDNNYRAGILIAGSSSSGAKATVRSNNIVNTESGYGIWNKVPSKFYVIAESNYLTNNSAGNYSSVSQASYALESIPESTIFSEFKPEPTTTYRVILSCPETEIIDLTQNYSIYKKV
jgi:hypothetical protein